MPAANEIAQNAQALHDFAEILQNARENGITNGQKVTFNISPAQKIESVEYVTTVDGTRLTEVFRTYRGTGEIVIKLQDDLPHKIIVMRRKTY